MNFQNFSSKVILSFLLIIFITNGSSAETYTWTGALSSYWLEPANWSPGGVPGGNDNVIIAESDNDPEIDGLVIGVKHIVINANAALIVVAEVGLSQLFCNTIKVEKFGTLINRSQISIWQTEESPYFDGQWGSLLNFGWAVNLETGSQFGETGLLTLASEIGSGLSNAEYFHNTGRIQVNNTQHHGIDVNGIDATFINDGIINIYEASNRGISTYAAEGNSLTTMARLILGNVIMKQCGYLLLLQIVQQVLLISARKAKT